MLNDGSVVPFGKRLQLLLDAHGPEASQAWLAARSGVDRSLISRIIQGKREPTSETLHCLASVLGMAAPELVLGTDAESRLLDDTVVRRADYEEAVRSFIELESKNRESEARVRSLAETLEAERKALKLAHREASDAAERAERAEARSAELTSEKEKQAGELRRYHDALARAVTEISLLKKRFEDLQKELGDAKQSSRTASIFAGVAALTGVATIAHFLGEEDSHKKRRGKKR